MLSSKQLFPLVFSRLKELREAAIKLDDRRFPLAPRSAGGDAVSGWSSGHHGRKRRAESWATASVFHFASRLTGSCLKRSGASSSITLAPPTRSQRIRCRGKRAPRRFP